MAEAMGKIIRALRRERGLTQEELAGRIGVTAQAISKWENETGLPDISQVVPLATELGVRTDVLFGLDPQDAETAVQKAAALEKEKNYSAEQSAALWKDMLKQYPKCAAVRYRLAGAHLKLQSYRDAAAQFERILEESTDEVLRMRTLDMLCFCYNRLSDGENAVRIAEMCPPPHINRLSLLAKIDGYERHNEVNAELLTFCLREICWCVRRMDYPNDTDRLAALSRVLQILTLFADMRDPQMKRQYEEIEKECGESGLAGLRDHSIREIPRPEVRGRSPRRE